MIWGYLGLSGAIGLLFGFNLLRNEPTEKPNDLIHYQKKNRITDYVHYDRVND